MKDNAKYQGLRRQLAEKLRSKGIASDKVLQVIENTPRHFFMDPALLNYAYEDKAYPIDSDQTISQPYTVAFQTQILDISFNDKILEIGTGSGYQTAILLGLSKNVFTIERQHKLFKKAQRLLNKLNLRPKKIVFGDGYNGLPENAPFEKFWLQQGHLKCQKNY